MDNAKLKSQVLMKIFRMANLDEDEVKQADLEEKTMGDMPTAPDVDNQWERVLFLRKLNATVLHDGLFRQ